MKKILCIGMATFLITQYLYTAQAPRTRNLWGRGNIQAIKEGAKRLWYGEGAQAAEIQKAPQLQKTVPATPTAKAQPSFFRRSAEHVSQSSWGQKATAYAQQTKQCAQRNKLKTALGITGGATVLAIAYEISDFAHTHYNMAMFDEDLISDEFSDAIVKLANLHSDSTGTAFIIRSEQEPESYFVLTAAHCVKDVSEAMIIINNKKKGPFGLMAKPIIIDEKNDIAVLLIPSDDVLLGEKTLGKTLPFIPFHKLSSIKPRIKEAVLLHGYPSFIWNKEPGFYRQKFVSVGPGEWPSQDTDPMTPGEVLYSSQKTPRLKGASGAPIIAMRNGEPEIIGIAAKQFILKGQESNGFLLATAVGQLPYYIQEAKEQQKNEKERLKKEDLEQAQALQYAKELFSRNNPYSSSKTPLGKLI